MNMEYFDLVLSDVHFAELVIAGLVTFGVFGAWRFFAIYLLLVFITFTQPDIMQYSMIILAVVMSLHYALASLSVLFSNETKSPFKDVT